MHEFGYLIVMKRSCDDSNQPFSQNLLSLLIEITLHLQQHHTNQTMQPIQVKFRWADLDPNRHVRNSAYPEVFVEIRMQLFKEAGFTMRTLGEMQIGPVVLQEHTYYLKEVLGDHEVYIDIQLNGMTEDQRYWKFAQHLYNHNGVLCTYHEFVFAVMDLKERQIILPPEGMLHTFLELPRTDHFEIFEKSNLKLERIPYSRKLKI